MHEYDVNTCVFPLHGIYHLGVMRLEFTIHNTIHAGMDMCDWKCSIAAELYCFFKLFLVIGWFLVYYSSFGENPKGMSQKEVK